jgi:hypothetical protein
LAILADQSSVRVLGLWILVEGFHVRVRRRRVEIEPAFLDVFAVIAFVTGQTVQAFLEDRVVLVPERDGEAEPALAIGDAEQAIFAPAIGAAARVIVRKRFPNRVAAVRVILPHRRPLAFGEIRSPALPIVGACGILAQTGRFGAQRLGWMRMLCGHDG